MLQSTAAHNRPFYIVVGPGCSRHGGFGPSAVQKIECCVPMPNQLPSRVYLSVRTVWQQQAATRCFSCTERFFLEPRRVNENTRELTQVNHYPVLLSSMLPLPIRLPAESEACQCTALRASQADRGCAG